MSKVQLNIINLDEIPTEYMNAEIFAYLMRAANTGKEMPLGATGFKASWKEIPLNSSILVIMVDNTIFFFAGSILDRGGMRFKRYHLSEID